MAKALMVAATGAALASGDEANILGYGADSTTEANTQVSCTEGATFSGFGAQIIAGNSGTATFRFRDAGADGNQTFQISGTGSGEDSTNSDVLSAADLFNFSYTDTGSNGTPSVIKCNVEFASGYGCFHAAANYTGIVHDAASTTTFINFGGSLGNDGTATRANAQWLNRAYTSIEAIQVRVVANARANNSVFDYEINATPGGTGITFATGETGLKTLTGIGAALADGDLFNASLTLDTGAEDLTVALVGCTLKSTNNKQDVWGTPVNGAQATVARAASSTANYVPIGGFAPTLAAFTEAQAAVKPGFAGTGSNVRCYLPGNTYSVAGTLKLYQNGSPVITTEITLLGGAAWYENTVDSVSFDADDVFSLEFDEGTTGSITIASWGLTLAPTTTTFIPYPRPRGLTGGMSNWGGGMQV